MKRKFYLFLYTPRAKRLFLEQSSDFWKHKWWTNGSYSLVVWKTKIEHCFTLDFAHLIFGIAGTWKIKISSRKYIWEPFMILICLIIFVFLDRSAEAELEKIQRFNCIFLKVVNIFSLLYSVVHLRIQICILHDQRLSIQVTHFFTVFLKLTY